MLKESSGVGSPLAEIVSFLPYCEDCAKRTKRSDAILPAFSA